MRLSSRHDVHVGDQARRRFCDGSVGQPRSDGSQERRLAIDTSTSGDGGIGLTPLAGGGAEAVRMAGLQAGPLGDGTSIRTVAVLAFRPLWPASW